MLRSHIASLTSGVVTTLRTGPICVEGTLAVGALAGYGHAAWLDGVLEGARHPHLLTHRHLVRIHRGRLINRSGCFRMLERFKELMDRLVVLIGKIEIAWDLLLKLLVQRLQLRIL